MSFEPLPARAYIPGGPVPRPPESAHAPGRLCEENWRQSISYHRGFAHFNAGFYWEAHEVWEALWHQAGRKGPVADLLRGLIKLAAAGVKVRQKQPHGVVTHLSRAAVAFESARVVSSSDRLLGLDLMGLIRLAESLATSPPSTDTDLSEPIVRVFPFELIPNEESARES